MRWRGDLLHEHFIAAKKGTENPGKEAAVSERLNRPVAHLQIEQSDGKAVFCNGELSGNF